MCSMSYCEDKASAHTVPCAPNRPLCTSCWEWAMGRITCPFHGDEC